MDYPETRTITWIDDDGNEIGRCEYIRADLAAPSAPAEVEGLVELWPSSSTSAFGDNQRWVRSKDYAALQAENERLRARAEKAEAALSAGLDACDDFDGPVSKSAFVNGQATCAQQIRAKLKGDV